MEDFFTITCHDAYNYGAVLQTYALYKYFTNLGLTGKVIDYRPLNSHKTSSKNILVILARPILRFPDFYKGRRVFRGFLNNNIELTERVKNEKEINEKLDKAKVYVTGSDQVWNCTPKGVGNDNNFFLAFVDGKKAKKVSYAASIAMNELNEDQKERFKKLLSDYSYISVREKVAVKLLKNIGINNVERVLDPVYLLNKEEWKKLVDKSKLVEKLKNEKYILVYGFLQQKNVYEYARKLGNKKNLKIFNVNTLIEDYFLDTDKYFWNVTPEDFLALIYYSQEVVTNSFHGLSFSLIFEKDFHLFGKKGNSSSRMFDMVKLINLEDRILKDSNTILDSKINYNEVKLELNKKIDESERYIEKFFYN